MHKTRESNKISCEHARLVLISLRSTPSAVNMGFKRSPPPFLAVANKTNKQVFRGLLGANFASAGSGILDTTVSPS